MSSGMDTELHSFNLENEVLKLKEDNVWLLREIKQLQENIIDLHKEVMRITGGPVRFR